MQDNKIPRNEPGVAGFASESWGNNEEPRFGEGVADTIDIEVTTAGAVDYKLYQVMNYNRTTKALTPAVVASGASNANAIMAMPFKTAGVVTARAAVYVDGHWAMDALIWDASFTTQTLKEGAFEALRTTILVSKKKFSDDAIDIPN